MERDRRGRGQTDRDIVTLLAVLVAIAGLAAAGFGGLSGDRGPRPVGAPATSTIPVALHRSSPPGPTGTPISSEGSPALRSALDPIWSATPGGCLTVAAGQTVLYEANADTLVAPASVTKLLTAAAALDILGEPARLRTIVRAAAAPGGGIVNGNVWLVGGGDPVLGTAARVPPSADPALHTPLEDLADRVVAAGVRRIEGGVIGDDTRYDAERYVDSWPRRFIADGESGPLSALSVNGGFRVAGHPGVPFLDPPSEAANLFTELLESRGVEITGTAAASPAAGAVELAAIDSPTVGELVESMLRDSDNGTAELLVKEIGVRQFNDGSTAAGVRAIEDVLMAAGLPVSGSVVADGSGLSRDNRVRCGLLTALLAARPEQFRERLAVAGQSGTLEHRLVANSAAGRLRAKTGSLDGVAALTGYADTPAGATLNFAFIINGLPPGESGRSLQDALIDVLLETKL